MRSRTTEAIPARLEAGRRRFERWRRTRQGHSRIQEPLWASAVKLAGVYGLCRAARALGLNYAAPTRRVACAAPHDSPGQKTARQKTAGQEPAVTFVELNPPAPACFPECIVELEDPRGEELDQPELPWEP